ncbi:MAG: glycosyltransferase family 39 protein [Verrucomicrobiota bacterium]|nr:glycosyltransferase family 39 protein [Verrucomicrobiota bacterium]
MAYSSISHKSLTFDEVLHISGGVNNWRNNDYRINFANGIFPQRIATFLILFDKKLKMKPLSDPVWQNKNEWFVSIDFLFGGQNNADYIAAKTRMIIILFSVVLALTVFFISKELFGLFGAFLSLFLYIFSPTVLANAPLVTSDLTVSLFFILTILAIWKILYKISLKNLFFLFFSASFLFISKMSAVLIIPMAFLLVLIRLFSPAPIVCVFKKKKWKFSKLKHKLILSLSLAIVCGIFISFVIWFAFGFRYSMFKNEQTGREMQNHNWEKMINNDDFIIKSVSFARKYKLLPEAYLYGFAYVIKHSKERDSFLNGNLSRTGKWYFFPYCALVKTPISMMFLVFLAGIVYLITCRNKKMFFLFLCKKLSRSNSLIIPLAVLVFVFLFFSLTSNLNIGFRHIFVCYPVLFVFLGSISLISKNKLRIFVYIPLGLLLLWFFTESLITYPDYLAYFNSFAGGSENGYEHLVDSSLDWGQDLKGFKLWFDNISLKKKSPKPNIYLSYFGSIPPDYYNYKEKVNYLPSFFEKKHVKEISFQPGFYCISATMLQHVYYPEYSRWNQKLEKKLNRYQKSVDDLKYLCSEKSKIKEKNKFKQMLNGQIRLIQKLKFAKFCNYLRKRMPNDNIGYSILIYNITKNDIHSFCKQLPENIP